MSLAELELERGVSSPRRRITVGEWEAMGRAGVFPPEERLELLDGEIRSMAPMESPHAACVRRLIKCCTRLFGERVDLSVQCPLRLSDRDEPEPDVCLLRPRADCYAGAHPTPADVLLVIEVADSSLRYDLHEKTPRYAACGVPEVWVVDLLREQVHRFSQPQGAAYSSTQTLGRGEVLEAALAAAGEAPLAVRLPVDELLGLRRD